MIRSIIWVGLGGLLGSMLRYTCYLIPHKGDSFWITLAINILGSFILGLLTALVNKGWTITEEYRLFMMVGICGGFTTYSTFSMEMTQLIQQNRWIQFSLYLSSSILAGILAFVAGQKMHLNEAFKSTYKKKP